MAAADPNRLTLTQRIACKPERAFDAWLDPAQLRRFMLPGPIALGEIAVDPRPGGEFLIVMVDGGRKMPHRGVYRTIERPKRLVFTWNSEAAGKDSLVTLDFEPHGADTVVTLTHERLPTPRARELHCGGWANILETLAREYGGSPPAKPDFGFTLVYPTTPEKLYAELATQAGIRNWWTKKCVMDERVGGHAEFPFPKSGFHARATILKLEPARLVEWRCIDCSHPPQTGFVDLHDWAGTTIRFELAQAAEGTELRFEHAGLALLECREQCSSAWRFFLAESLMDHVRSGRGQPGGADLD